MFNRDKMLVYKFCKLCRLFVLNAAESSLRSPLVLVTSANKERANVASSSGVCADLPGETGRLLRELPAGAKSKTAIILVSQRATANTQQALISARGLRAHIALVDSFIPDSTRRRSTRNGLIDRRC